MIPAMVPMIFPILQVNIELVNIPIKLLKEQQSELFTPSLDLTSYCLVSLRNWCLGTIFTSVLEALYENYRGQRKLETLYFQTSLKLCYLSCCDYKN